MDIYFITGNKNKFEEVNQIFPIIKQLEIDLPEIQEIDPKKIIEAKLLEALKHTKDSIIVEDTSLYFDCLNGLPGPLIKWFLQTIGNESLYELAKKYNNTKAEAKTIIGYAKNPNDIHYFEGIIKGNIVEPKSKKGFGWDSIFQPDGYSQSFAELGKEKKNEISMRKIALNKLEDFLYNNK